MTSVWKAGTAAVVVAVVLVGILAWRASSRIMEVGFWFDISSADLPADATHVLGGPLSDADLVRIEQVCREELRHAFKNLRIAFTDNKGAFWRIVVRQDVVVPNDSIYKGRPSAAAETRSLGPLGAAATVSFFSLAQYAIVLAPSGATRDDIVDGIGRGIARAAAHEVGHVVASSGAHDASDVNSYEYPFANRASQYYGTLHWTSAWPYLVATLGARAPAAVP